jgi:hypothetical protein
MPVVHVNAPGSTHSRKRLGAALLIFVVFPAAAGGYYFGYHVGAVSLSVTDDAIDQFAHLNITFSQVQVKSAGALTLSPWVDIELTTTTIDLVTLHDNITQRLGVSHLTAGSYSQLRVVVASAVGELKDGSSANVNVPSGELRTDAAFAVKAQGEVSLMLRLHIVEAGAVYNLRPVFAGASSV